MNFKDWFYELKITNELKWRDFFCLFISIVSLIFLSICLLYTKSIQYGIKIIACILTIYVSIVYANYCVIKNKKDAVGSRLENKELEEKNINLLEITDNVRCFKHDFNNIIQAIGGYILLKDLNSLETYLSSLVDECNRINLIDVLNGQLSDNPAIYGVLINKLRIAEQRNVKMNIEVLVNMNEFNEKSYLISRMLGILIDNALEASADCNEQKIVNIRFCSVSDKKKNVITIENTYSNKNIDTTKIFEKNYTTKTGNTGLGLWKIKNILEKNHNFELFTTKDDNLFKQELEIYS